MQALHHLWHPSANAVGTARRLLQIAAQSLEVLQHHVPARRPDDFLVPGFHPDVNRRMLAPQPPRKVPVHWACSYWHCTAEDPSCALRCQQLWQQCVNASTSVLILEADLTEEHVNILWARHGADDLLVLIFASPRLTRFLTAHKIPECC